MQHSYTITVSKQFAKAPWHVYEIIDGKEISLGDIYDIPVKEGDEIECEFEIEHNEYCYSILDGYYYWEDGERKFFVSFDTSELLESDIESVLEEVNEIAFERYSARCANNPNLKGSALSNFLAQDYLP